MDIQRFGVKLFAQESSAPEASALIPVFHSWIQKNALEEHLLVDVHDYGHVSAGPGILLVAHQANYSWDLADDRPGLLYSRKQRLEGNLEERLEGVVHSLLRAAELLEGDPSLGLRFRTDELLLVANDRLRAPNTNETFRKFQSKLAPLLERLLAGGSYQLVHRDDPKERFAVTIRWSSPQPIHKMLERMVPSSKRLIV